MSAPRPFGRFGFTRLGAALGSACAVLLLVSLGAGAQSGGAAEHGDVAQKAPAGFAPDATLAEIMEYIVMPNADKLWGAVSVTVGEEGVVEEAPETDAEWFELRTAALTLAEASNLLVVPGRRVDAPGAVAEYPEEELSPSEIHELQEEAWGAWVGHAQVLHEVAKQMIAAVDARDTQAVTDVGGTLDSACEGCHLQFWYPPQEEE
ncbi:MAG TPA: hypothetical protein VF329_00635 [Gammaproteobacteria bacterium]